MTDTANRPAQAAAQPAPNKGNRTLRVVILGVVCALAVVCTVVRFFIITNFVDPNTGFYTFGSNLPAIYDYFLYTVVVALFILPLILFRKVRFKTVSSDNPAMVFASALLGFMLVASCILQVIFIFTQNNGTSMSSYISTYAGQNGLLAAQLILSIPAAVYFFRISWRTVTKPSGSTLTLAMFPVLWAILRVSGNYFNMSHNVNPSFKLYELLTMVLVMLYLLFEAKFYTGNGKFSLWFAFGLLSVLMLSISAIPNLFLSLFWIYKPQDSILNYATDIVMLIYIVARLFTVLFRRGRVVSGQ